MPTVLVVDDSPVDRRLVGGLLGKSEKLVVEFAGDGKEALDAMRRSLPNLVVTDLIMPEMDGLDLVAAVVGEFPLVPVILMTGKGSEEIAVKALQAGASSYVPKAVLADHLLETVANVLSVADEEQTNVRLMDAMTRSHCTFELDNDGSMISPLVNYLHRTVRSVGLCDESNGIRISVALEEALNNALYHGNLGLSSDLREGNRERYKRMVAERTAASPYSDRRIRVDVEVTRQEGTFVIRDEGDGFDPNSLPDPTDPANLEKVSGRGLLLMRTFMDGISFNERGNEVTLIKRAAAAET